MTQFGGGGATTSNDPLLDFQLRPVGARRNWRNVLNKQRFEATLQQHRDITPDDNLGEELTHALRRSIERQIASNPSLTPHSMVHFAMQSSTFTHAFQSTTFTVREFEEGSERLDTYLEALAAKLEFQRRLYPRRYLHRGHHLRAHPWSWQRKWQTIQAQCCRRGWHYQKVTCCHQEQGQPLLHSCHRHHEGLGGR